MSDNDNDIDALLTYLAAHSRFGFHSALTALVAERDKLEHYNAEQIYRGNSVGWWYEKHSASSKSIRYMSRVLTDAGFPADGDTSITDRLTALVAERDGLREQLRLANIDQFNTEAEANDRDRELRERLVCAALTGLCADRRYHGAEEVVVEMADRTLAAMRKGEADGK